MPTQPSQAATPTKATYGVEPFLSDKLNPIFAKDMRTGLLGKAHYFFRVAYVATIGSELLMLAVMVFNPMASLNGFTAGWAQIHLMLLMAAGALFGARSLAPEREQQTLPQLLTVPLPASAIILGKMMAVMAYTSYVFLTGLPLVLLLAGLGELSWAKTWGFLALELACGAFAAAWGLFCSIQAMTVRRALGWSLAGVLVLVLAGPVIGELVLSGNSRAELILDPVSWFASTLHDTVLPLSAMGNVFQSSLGSSWLLTVTGYALSAVFLLFATAQIFKNYARSA